MDQGSVKRFRNQLSSPRSGADRRGGDRPHFAGAACALAEFSVRLDDRICRLHIRHEPMEQESRQ
jgi:hypothetical protein